MDFICEPLYEHLVHQEHLEYLRHLAAKDTNNIDNNGPIWTSLDPMLEGTGQKLLVIVSLLQMRALIYLNRFRNKFLLDLNLHFSGCRKNRENWSALRVKKEEPHVES